MAMITVGQRIDAACERGHAYRRKQCRRAQLGVACLPCTADTGQVMAAAPLSLLLPPPRPTARHGQLTVSRSRCCCTTCRLWPHCRPVCPTCRPSACPSLRAPRSSRSTPSSACWSSTSSPVAVSSVPASGGLFAAFGTNQKGTNVLLLYFTFLFLCCLSQFVNGS